MCDGDDTECPTCTGVGQIAVDGCVMQYIDRNVCDVVFAADMAQQGVFPVAGGWLDQSQQLLDAIRCVWRDEALAMESKR